jgi:hypothetical protein
MGWKMIINKSKLAVIAAVAAASIALPVLAQAATTTAHRHRHHAHRTVATQPAAPGYRANAAVAPSVNPVDDPSMTGGGTAGYNACAGHPRC